jgi:hypothetical protein
LNEKERNGQRCIESACTHDEAKTNLVTNWFLDPVLLKFSLFCSMGKLKKIGKLVLLDPSMKKLAVWLEKCE